MALEPNTIHPAGDWLQVQNEFLPRREFSFLLEVDRATKHVESAASGNTQDILKVVPRMAAGPTVGKLVLLYQVESVVSSP